MTTHRSLAHELEAPDGAGCRSKPGQLVVAGTLYTVFAVFIALFRMRMSPLYPKLNDVNSDFSVYQVIGNSWAHGKLPYRDVFDVKGPFFYLLFGGFARLRAWSIGPPLAMLAGCAVAALWLAFRIARRFVGELPATLSELSVGALVYLTVLGVPTSFTCEELAVPGVLLLLWLMLRTLAGEPVAAWWWVLDGAVFGALFWAKYQVIAPWGAVLVALLVVGRGGRRGMTRGQLLRIVSANVAGCAIVTLPTLAAYTPVLGTMLRAYFVAKLAAPRRDDELVLEGRYVAEMIGSNPVTVGTLCLTFAALVVYAVVGTGSSRETRAAPTIFAIAMLLSMCAAVFGVRHPANTVVPLCFVAVALPMTLSRLPRPGIAQAAAAGAVAVVAFIGVVPSIQQSRALYGLGRSTVPVHCAAWSSGRLLVRPSTTAAFVRAAHGLPILSINSLQAARALYRTHTVQPQRFEFVDLSWVSTTGAASAQPHYLRRRTFRYVWVSGRRPLRGNAEHVDFGRAGRLGVPTAGEQVAIDQGYVPILSCGTQVLLRSR